MPVSVIVPSADVAAAWTRSAGSNNYENVDNPEPNDDTDYNSTSDDPNRDLFTGANLGIPSDATIVEVLIKMWARKAAGTALNIGFSWDHDSTVNETSFALTESYAKYTQDITGSESWQPGDFDDAGRLQIGYYHDQSQSREARVTMVWAEVRWTPATTTRSPGTTVDDATVGTEAWVNPNNTQASDDTYATAGVANAEITHYIKATNFGFTAGEVPDGYTIDGIEVWFEISKQDGFLTSAEDHEVKIVQGGAIKTQNKAVGKSIDARDTSLNYGTSSDLWGESWSASDIRNSGFGVVVAVKSTVGAQTLQIDNIEITVYASAGDNGQRIRQIISVT